MAKFRVSITVEVDAESETSALASVVSRQRVLPITRTLGTYIPKRGDIVTVSAPHQHQANDYEGQGIRYDIPYRVIKADSPQVTHLGRSGHKRVIAWNNTLQPFVSDEQVARDRRIRATDEFRERGIGVGGG